MLSTLELNKLSFVGCYDNDNPNTPKGSTQRLGVFESYKFELVYDPTNLFGAALSVEGKLN